MKKVLIVDDSPTIRRMVAASLQSLRDVLFQEAANGLEAIESLSLGPVALMILDLNMPEMHGIDVLRFVRSQQKHRDISIIVLTTKHDAASQSAALSAGASA